MSKSLADFRRDAVSLLVYQRSIDIRYIDREGIVTDEDVQLIGDYESEEGWVGNFQIAEDENATYKIEYKHKSEMFYITEYISFRCIPIDPDLVLYSE